MRQYLVCERESNRLIGVMPVKTIRDAKLYARAEYGNLFKNQRAYIRITSSKHEADADTEREIWERRLYARGERDIREWKIRERYAAAVRYDNERTARDIANAEELSLDEYVHITTTKTNKPERVCPIIGRGEVVKGKVVKMVEW